MLAPQNNLSVDAWAQAGVLKQPAWHVCRVPGLRSRVSLRLETNAHRRTGRNSQHRGCRSILSRTHCSI